MASVMGEVQLDETSCGPLCQHPHCWASNRRVERGLPRYEVFPEKEGQLELEGLPTLKIQNMLDDYGISRRDKYPSTHHVAALGMHPSKSQRQRSASAPSPVTSKSMYPPTPSQSPQSGGRGEAPQKSRHRSRSALLEPIKGSYPPKLSRIHLNQLCAPMDPSNEIFNGSQVYVWRRSRKAVQKMKDKTIESSEPRIISPRDITETLMPSTIMVQKQTAKKMKTKRSKQTPTGGRPYTHPSKSPPAITRRTLPVDVDEGIAQLLSLPREIMLEILEHTKESDLFDKNKVQALLAKVMPHVHFDTNLSPQEQVVGSPPLHAMGLLRNQKMPILEGKQKFDKTEIPLQSKLPRMPLFLDDAAMPGVMTSISYQGGGDECHLQQMYDEDYQSLMPPTIVSEGISRRKIHLGVMSDVGHLYQGKITSVSAKSLPPLQPGTRTAKPFDYSTQSLDLALTPLPTPEIPTPDEPSTPRTGKASTLYVTLPSEPSEDRMFTPVTTAKHPHLAILRQESPYTRSMTSSHPSEEFGPSKVLSPSYSTHVPTAPQNSCRENTFLSARTSTSYDNREFEDLVPEKTNMMGSGSTSGRTMASNIEQGLHTIHEHVVSEGKSTPDTVAAHLASVTSTSNHPPRSVSPWDTVNQLGHRKTPPTAQHTPTPSTSSPEVWPIVDESSYLHSPENIPADIKKDIPETMAPPPSPEPRLLSSEAGTVLESKVINLSHAEDMKCTGVSLATLTEEEEEENGRVSTEGLMIQRVMEENKLDERTVKVGERECSRPSGILPNSPVQLSPVQKAESASLPSIQENDDNVHNGFPKDEENPESKVIGHLHNEALLTDSIANDGTTKEGTDSEVVGGFRDEIPTETSDQAIAEGVVDSRNDASLFEEKQSSVKDHDGVLNIQNLNLASDTHWKVD